MNSATEKARRCAIASPGQSNSQHRELVHNQLFDMYDDHLSRNKDIHWLDDPRVAALVRRSLYFWNGKKYGLLAYCIMPNHVHMPARPFDLEPATVADRESLEPGEWTDDCGPLSKIMHSLKSYTGSRSERDPGSIGHILAARVVRSLGAPTMTNWNGSWLTSTRTP